MAVEMTPNSRPHHTFSHALHLFSPLAPPSAAYSTSGLNPLGGFEVEECLNAGLVHSASRHNNRRAEFTFRASRLLFCDPAPK